MCGSQFNTNMMGQGMGHMGNPMMNQFMTGMPSMSGMGGFGN